MSQMAQRASLHWLRRELQSERLWSSLTAGVLMGTIEVIVALSVGSLIFSGALTPYLSYGFGVALITTTIILVGVSLGSSVPGITGGTQDSPSVILAVIAAILVSTLPTAGDALPTVLATITITALLTGAFFLVLGSFKLGGLVRFIPYPVVGGFLAGTGWLLVQGAFGVMADFPLTLSNVPLLLQSDQLILWCPGAILALILCFAMRRLDHFAVMPGILVAFIALFFLALLAMGISLDDAIARGLLLGEVSGQAVWQPLALGKHLLAANWVAILGQGGNIAIILVVSVVSLLLNASALELTFRQDVDLNRELQVAGLANILSGLVGGAVAYHALDLSTLCYRTGARSRLPGLIAGAICAAGLLAGSPLLAFFPKPILGGLLLFMGLVFLTEWVFDSWFRLSRIDYAVVILILVVIGATNFLVGVGVGLVAAIVLFVLSYSRISVVRHELSGAEIKSTVERCAYHRQTLTELGQHVYIVELHGFVFFGTANALLDQIRARIHDPERPAVRYIILDFRRVTGLDSSAAISFAKVRQLAETQDITVLLTHVSETIRRQLELGDLFQDERVFVCPDLDHGLEWCENQLLATSLVTQVHVPTRLQAQLADSGFDPAHVGRLMKFLERVEVGEGEYLIRQGDEADDLYFIELGMVSVYLESETSGLVRLRTLGPGTVVGELNLYRGTRRTASVVVDVPTSAYRLTRAALLEMREQEPDLAAIFHEFVVRLLAERVVTTNRLVEAMSR